MWCYFFLGVHCLFYHHCGCVIMIWCRWWGCQVVGSTVVVYRRRLQWWCWISNRLCHHHFAIADDLDFTVEVRSSLSCYFVSSLQLPVLAVYEQHRNKFVDFVSDLVVLNEINDGSLNISKEWYLTLWCCPTSLQLHIINYKCDENLELFKKWSSCLPEICGTGLGISTESLASFISLVQISFNLLCACLDLRHHYYYFRNWTARYVRFPTICAVYCSEL